MSESLIFIELILLNNVFSISPCHRSVSFNIIFLYFFNISSFKRSREAILFACFSSRHFVNKVSNLISFLFDYQNKLYVGSLFS
ncbi:uncharacterized protein BX663DRAFT_513107 [Cokeromyces recurvatus]|uniref:uncharacterized protein n=1 Tax=Cokeromyces recurvatus TaxID=90255 RepID=UPI00221EF664|nr:uncharacterized protein BX663DRAFT_513107 [Cokeromyces recurvatus]KAI7901974.1 hypothetical protein BX663DRAFT_513107 [Cokeromyces recurvatus]